MKNITMMILVSLVIGCDGDWKPIQFPITVNSNNPELESITKESINWWYENLFDHYQSFCAANILADCDEFPNLLQYTKDTDAMMRIQASDTLYQDYGYDGLAEVTISPSNFYLKCEVYLNSHHITLDVISHEIGHCLGLVDLYESENIINIMYGITNDRPSHVQYWQAKDIFKRYLKVKATPIFAPR